MRKKTYLESLPTIFPAQETEEPVVDQNEISSLLSTFMTPESVEKTQANRPLTELNNPSQLSASLMEPNMSEIDSAARQLSNIPKNFSPRPLEFEDDIINPSEVEAAKPEPTPNPESTPKAESKEIAQPPKQTTESEVQGTDPNNIYDLLRAFKAAGAGLTSAASGVKVSGEAPLATKFKEENIQKEKDALTAEQMRLANKTKLSQSQTSDPNSDVSKYGREFYEKVTGNKAPENLSYDQVKEFLTEERLRSQFEESVQARLQIAREGAANRASQASDRLSEAQKEAKRKGEQFISREWGKHQEQMNKKAEEFEKREAQIADVRRTIEMAKTNPSDFAALGTKIAKAYGEVGALTENDVTRYVQNKALVAQIRQNLLGLASGTLDPRQAKYLTETINAMAAMEKDRKNIVKRKYLEQFARRANEYSGYGYSINDVAYLAGENALINYEDEYMNSPQTRELVKAQLEKDKKLKGRGDVYVSEDGKQGSLVVDGNDVTFDLIEQDGVEKVKMIAPNNTKVLVPLNQVRQALVKGAKLMPATKAPEAKE